MQNSGDIQTRDQAVVTRIRVREEWLACKQQVLEHNGHLQNWYEKIRLKNLTLKTALPSLSQIITAAQGRHSYAEWLMRLMYEQRLSGEDLPQIEVMLKLYEHHKNGIKYSLLRKHKSADLTQLASWQDLYEIVEPYINTPGSGFTPAMRMAVARGEAFIMGRSKRLTAVVIKSVAAAVEFEKGRLWCSSYTTSPNFFYAYASSGPVIDLLDDTGRAMFGLNMGSGGINNAANKSCSLADVFAYDPTIFHTLKSVLVEAIRNKKFPLQSIPADYHSIELCMAAVMHHDDAIEYISPALHQNAEYINLCFAAVIKSGKALRHAAKTIPDHPRFFELCETAVTKDGLALAYVPAALHTHSRFFDLCLHAVQQNGNALISVPDSLRSHPRYFELCVAAVKRHGEALRHVDATRFTDEQYTTLCHSAVFQNGLALEHVLINRIQPANYAELCRQAVQQHGNALKHVAKTAFDGDDYFDICLSAVSQRGRALQHVSVHEHSTEKYIELCRAAIAQDGNALKHVSQEISHHPAYFGLCQLAVNGYGRALQHVFHPVVIDERYVDLCLAAVTNYGHALQDIDKSVHKHPRYMELCKAAINHHGSALQHVAETAYSHPDYFELCLNAVKSHGYILTHVSQGLTTDPRYFELCLAAVKQNGLALGSEHDWMKRDPRYGLLCAAAVGQNGRALNTVPEQYMTKELCDIAVANIILEYHTQSTPIYLPKMPSQFADDVIKENGLSFTQDGKLIIPPIKTAANLRIAATRHAAHARYPRIRND